ncbi:tryptophan transporter [Thermoanaerobacterium sp. DL9XJH110]|jgi:hypothetical protein|uniref:tryptophan transporter n=1 Tax=Thermoanaerobacterium sp. DL9XJH110 TaxID=3386643 RepID=UPI003BB5A6AA
MKLKDMILTALLMAIGLVLHQVVPPIVGGMKPNFLLAMLFVALFINNSPKNAFLAGVLGGTFAALTTTFPGGQIANFFEEIITAFVVSLLIKLMSKLSPHISVPVVGFLGTVESGTVFLTIALLVVGSLPVAFPVLFMTVVIPTAIINTFVTYVCYNIVFAARKVMKNA